MDIYLPLQPTVLLLCEPPSAQSPLAQALQPLCTLQTIAPSRLDITGMTKAPSPDLILLDGDLPGTDSQALCLRLTHDPVTQRIPIIMFSRQLSTADELRGFESGAIPISARLMALADVYDAIISRRVYKEGMPHATAVNIIVQGRGQHFDPDIVDAFLSLLDEFQDIAQRFADSDEDMQKKQDYLEVATALSPGTGATSTSTPTAAAS